MLNKVGKGFISIRFRGVDFTYSSELPLPTGLDSNKPFFVPQT